MSDVTIESLYNTLEAYFSQEEAAKGGIKDTLDSNEDTILALGFDSKADFKAFAKAVYSSKLQDTWMKAEHWKKAYDTMK